MFVCRNLDVTSNDLGVMAESRFCGGTLPDAS